MVLLALLGELLLCAEAGGILREENIETFAARDDDRQKWARAIWMLRNTICHPMAATNRAAFLGYVQTEFRDETWAAAPSASLASRDASAFALRLIDNIGRRQAEHWNIRGLARGRR